MITERSDHDGWSEIIVYNAPRDPWNAYRIVCMDVDINPAGGGGMLPTANILLPAMTQADHASARRLAREYDVVADIAEALEAEKRAAFVQV